MHNQIKPLSHFQVVGICRTTGKPQFASVTAPSQADADDFVADVQSNWIIVRDNSDLLPPLDLEMVDAIFGNWDQAKSKRWRSVDECDHCAHRFPVDELVPCAVEPDFRFCGDCADKLRD